MSEGKSFTEQWYDPELHGRQGWVRRTDTTPPEHVCAPPMRERVWLLPESEGGDGMKGHREMVPEGQWDDLWRCSCGQLWRVGDDCDGCDQYGLKGDHGNLTHVRGLAWRPATFWQRIRHRKAKR